MDKKKPTTTSTTSRDINFCSMGHLFKTLLEFLQKACRLFRAKTEGQAYLVKDSTLPINLTRLSVIVGI